LYLFILRIIYGFTLCGSGMSQRDTNISWISGDCYHGHECFAWYIYWLYLSLTYMGNDCGIKFCHKNYVGFNITRSTEADKIICVNHASLVIIFANRIKLLLQSHNCNLLAALYNKREQYQRNLLISQISGHLLGVCRVSR